MWALRNCARSTTNGKNIINNDASFKKALLTNAHEEQKCLKIFESGRTFSLVYAQWVVKTHGGGVGGFGVRRAADEGVACLVEEQQAKNLVLDQFHLLKSDFT